MRRFEAAALSSHDVGLSDNVSALLQVRRSKADPDAEGAVLNISRNAAEALQAIMPENQTVVDPTPPGFGLSTSQIGRRVKPAVSAAGLGEGSTGHSGKAGMEKDLVASGPGCCNGNYPGRTWGRRICGNWPP